MKTKIHKQHDGDCTIYRALINNFCTDGICTCGYGHEYSYLNNGDHKNLFSDERLQIMKKEADKQWKRKGSLRARETFEKKLRKLFNSRTYEPTKGLRSKVNGK